MDYKMGYMVVRGEETRRVLLDEIAIVVLENPAIAITGCLIEAMIEKKIKVIFCDKKRSPTAELIPHHGSHDSTAKIRQQAAWQEEVKAQIWREIVTEKIRQQAAFLLWLDRDREAELLLSYMDMVTQYEQKKLFVFYNLRSVISDGETNLLLDSILRHEYNVLMVESSERPRLSLEERYVVDGSLCEIG